MREFGKLWKINRRFYLLALIIVLLFVMWDCTYICNYERVMFSGKSVKQGIEEMLDSYPKVEKIGPVLLTEITDEKVDDMSLFGTTFVAFGIIILITARYMLYADRRTREVSMTWPVRMWKRTVFDYFMMLFILMLAWAVETSVLYIAGNHYNQVAKQVAIERSLDISLFDNLAAENQRFLLLMFVCLLYMLLFYTFIYMGVTAAKNPLVGIPVCFVWLGTWIVVSEEIWFWLWDLEKLNDVVDQRAAMSTGFKLYCDISDIWFIGSIYDDLKYNGLTGVKEEWSGLYLISNIMTIGILILMICLLALLAIHISKKKELATGKVLYSRFMDIFTGICVAILVYYFGSMVVNEVVMLLAMILVIGVCYYFFIYKSKSQNKWEVK